MALLPVPLAVTGVTEILPSLKRYKKIWKRVVLLQYNKNAVFTDYCRLGFIIIVAKLEKPKFSLPGKTRFIINPDPELVGRLDLR